MNESKGFYLTHVFPIINDLKLFSLKCLIITICFSYILGNYYPRYEFNRHDYKESWRRHDKITGKVELLNR